MPPKIDYSIATSEQIEKALSEQLENIRLMRNLTQAQLAIKAGISTRTLARLEKGEDVSLDTFVRVLIALEIQSNFQMLLPDTNVRPIERVKFSGSERKRSRSKKSHDQDATWAWGDESENQK